MAFGNYYGMGYQPIYNPSNPTGAMPDTLNQYKMPYQQPMQPVQTAQTTQPQQNGNSIIWVQGEAGAKSFLVAPGQSVLLMDSEASRFYIKASDNTGMPLPLRTFEYTEIIAGQALMPNISDTQSNVSNVDLSQFVTHDELNEKLSQLSPATKKTTKAKEETTNA